MTLNRLFFKLSFKTVLSPVGQVPFMFLGVNPFYRIVYRRKPLLDLRWRSSFKFQVCDWERGAQGGGGMESSGAYHFIPPPSLVTVSPASAVPCLIGFSHQRPPLSLPTTSPFFLSATRLPLYSRSLTVVPRPSRPLPLTRSRSFLLRILIFPSPGSHCRVPT